MIDSNKPLEIVHRPLGSDITTTHRVNLVSPRFFQPHRLPPRFFQPHRLPPRLIVERKDRQRIYENFFAVGFLMNGDAEYPENPWRLRNVAEEVKPPFAMTEEEARKKIEEINNPDEKWRPLLIAYFKTQPYFFEQVEMLESGGKVTVFPNALAAVKKMAKAFREIGIPEGE